MDFSSDLPALYDVLGDSAMLGAVVVPGVFDARSADVLGMVSGIRPVFRCAASSPIQKGDTLTIGGVSYKTKAGETHGPDEIIWPLEKV